MLARAFRHLTRNLEPAIPQSRQGAKMSASGGPPAPAPRPLRPSRRRVLLRREHVAEGLAPQAPACLYHSHFPRSRLLLLERLAQWLVDHDQPFRGDFDFARALLLLTEETGMLGYTSDHVAVQWYPAGFSIVE